MEPNNPISEIPRLKSGRPKRETEFNRKDYNKNYYLNNKSKYIGDYHCPACNVICSLANKSRHFKSKPHVKKVDEIINC